MIGVETRVRTDTNAAAALRHGYERFAMDVAARGFRVSQERVAVDSGQLQQSGVTPQKRDDGSVVWGYNAEYARWVELGSNPHWAPIEPLKGWARRVLGNESAAYAVQRKIAQEGTDPQPFIAPAIEAMRDYARAYGLDAAFTSELGK
jgi:hypothetical protein